MKLFGVERFTEQKLVRLSHYDLVLDSRFGTSLTSPGFTSSMAVQITGMHFYTRGHAIDINTFQKEVTMSNLI